jgi:hypothetical protein
VTQLPIEQLASLQQAILDVVRKYLGQFSRSGLAKPWQNTDFPECGRLSQYRRKDIGYQVDILLQQAHFKKIIKITWFRRYPRRSRGISALATGKDRRALRTPLLAINVYARQRPFFLRVAWQLPSSHSVVLLNHLPVISFPCRRAIVVPG